MRIKGSIRRIDEHERKGAARRRRRGAVMVETALILLAFIILMVGVFDFAQVLFVHQALVERARKAARWGALSNVANPDTPPDLEGAANIVLYGQATPPSGSSPYLGLTPQMVSVTTAGAGTDDYRLVVQISNYRFSMLSPLTAGQHQGQPIVVSAPMGYR
jgi:Flp pilus assembly protein TadG